MKNQTPPNPAVKRLSLYLRRLQQLSRQGIENVSSQTLADLVHSSAAQVRKDLGYFGQFGRRGVGYRVDPLIESLRRIFGTDKTWNVVLIGVGNVGRALLRYRGFAARGFEVVAAFDSARSKVGKKVAGVQIYHISKLQKIAGKHKARLAILTVPTAAAQDVADRICKAGIKGILNFAPTTIETPKGVTVGPVDLATQLEQLSFLAAGKSS